MAARATPASVRVVTGIVCKSVCVAQDLFDSGHRDDVMVKYPLSVCREGLLGHYNPQPTLTQIMTNPLLSVTPIPPQIFRCRVVWLWFYGSVVEMTMNFVYRIVVACRRHHLSFCVLVSLSPLTPRPRQLCKPLVYSLRKYQ